MTEISSFLEKYACAAELSDDLTIEAADSNPDRLWQLLLLIQIVNQSISAVCLYVCDKLYSSKYT